MKAEKVILSFVAIFVGLVAAGIAFYLYQLTKTVPSPTPLSTNKEKSVASPTPDSSNFLAVESPRDEEVFNKKVIVVRGKTVSGSTIIVTSEDGDQVVTPAKNGDFTLSETLPDGTTLLQITAILPNGEEKQVVRTVTYSTETF